MQDLRERLKTNMADTCARIPEVVRMLFVHGGQDVSVPVHNAQQYATSLPHSQVRILDKAGHNFDRDKDRQWLLSNICSFIMETCQA